MARELRIGPKKPTKRQRQRVSTDRARGVRRAKKGKGRCAICGWSPPFLVSGRSTGLHGHHVIPVAEGGDCGERNVIVLCPNHHAVAHLVGDAVYDEAFRGRFSPREQLVHWLRLADSDPQQCVVELAEVGRRVRVAPSPESHPVKTDAIA